MSTPSVLITRPAHQNDALHQLLENAGAKPFLFPTIVIEPVTSKILDDHIKHLNKFALIIFTSRNAVLNSQALIKHYWPTLPTTCQFAAIGTATQHALQQNAWACSICPSANFNSEALLALPEFLDVKGKSILIITGKNSRDYLLNTLVARGAVVSEAICYHRKVPNYSTSAIMDLKQRNFDFIVCSSNESLQNLNQLLGKENLTLWKNSQIIGFSERLYPLAKTLGFNKQPMIAVPASDKAIVATICSSEERSESGEK